MEIGNRRGNRQKKSANLQIYCLLSIAHCQLCSTLRQIVTNEEI